jgi:saccharopine dehydrogenase-like NADP-dependent oxidoreductase
MIMISRAQETDVVILNEIGLDPGIDHMSAMKMIDEIKAEGGKVKRSLLMNIVVVVFF